MVYIAKRSELDLKQLRSYSRVFGATKVRCSTESTHLMF